MKDFEQGRDMFDLLFNGLHLVAELKIQYKREELKQGTIEEATKMRGDGSSDQGAAVVVWRSGQILGIFSEGIRFC